MRKGDGRHRSRGHCHDIGHYRFWLGAVAATPGHQCIVITDSQRVGRAGGDSPYARDYSGPAVGLITEPMAAHAYRLGAAMPGLVLGVLPWLFGLATGNGPAFLFGLLFTIAALGDAMILWLLRGVAPEAQVIDHPSRAGCYVMDLH